MVMVMVIYGDGDVRCDGDVFAYAEAARRPASNTASILTYLSTAFHPNKSLWYQVYGVQSKVSGPSQVCDVKSMESSLLLTVYDVMSIVFGHIYGVWSKRV